MRLVRASVWPAAAAAALVTAASPAFSQRTIDLTPTTKPGSQPAPVKLSMDEAVATAIKNSKVLRAAEQAILKSRARVAEAKSAFMPTLSSDLQFTHLDEGATAVIPTGQGNITIPIVRQDQRQVSLTAALPVDIAGQIRAAVSASEFGEIAARLDMNRARNQLVMEVKGAYLNVLRARAVVGVAEQALKNAKDRLFVAEANLRAGTGTRFDVLRAETEVANAEQQVISAKNRVDLANAALNNTLNLDQNTPLDLADEAGGAEPPAKDFGESVEAAYKQRPEVLQADANIRAAEKGLVLAQRSQMPTLALAWSFQYTPDAGGFDPKETSWAAVAKVTLPLFEGGLAKARREQARADVNTVKLAKLQIMDGIALEARQAYLNVVEAQERLRVADAVLAQAQEQYRLAEVRFKSGVTLVPGGSPLLEISDAQTALTQAQTNRINAQYDLKDAVVKLERAMGRYAYDAQR
jgi:outer membrane protein TolC